MKPGSRKVTIQVIPSLAVIPAKAGIQLAPWGFARTLDESSTACTRLRGNDLNSYAGRGRMEEGEQKQNLFFGQMCNRRPSAVLRANCMEIEI